MDSSRNPSGDGAIRDLGKRLEIVLVWDGTDTSAHSASLFAVVEGIEAWVMYAAVALRAIEVTCVDAESKSMLGSLEMPGDAALCDGFLYAARCSGTGSVGTFQTEVWLVKGDVAVRAGREQQELYNGKV